jgi:hypothetical protein
MMRWKPREGILNIECRISNVEQGKTNDELLYRIILLFATPSGLGLLIPSWVYRYFIPLGF